MFTTWKRTNIVEKVAVVLLDCRRLQGLVFSVKLDRVLENVFFKKLWQSTTFCYWQSNHCVLRTDVANTTPGCTGKFWLAQQDSAKFRRFGEISTFRQIIIVEKFAKNQFKGGLKFINFLSNLHYFNQNKLLGMICGNIDRYFDNFQVVCH
jgi:hypothetical protein